MSAYLLQKKIEYLRKKFINDQKNNDMLNRILWYSLPVVYGRYTLSQEHWQIRRDYRKAWRIKKHCTAIINQPAFVPLMITLTFNDESLAFAPDTHRRYVKEYLTRWCIAYYAFVDYGKKTNRKHYHVIACVPPCNLSRAEKHLRLPSPWGYGFYNIKEIHSKEAYRYSSKAILYASKFQEEHFRSRKSKSLYYDGLPSEYQLKQQKPVLDLEQLNIFV